MSDLIISVDRGGTFADVICEYTALDGYTRKRKVFKLLSVNPAAYEDSTAEAIRLCLNDLTTCHYEKDDLIDENAPIKAIRIGTTVATNALIERKGVDVAFITTAGLEGLLKIGDQTRPDIFDLNIRLPQQIYKELISAEERVFVIPNSDTYNNYDETNGQIYFKEAFPQHTMHISPITSEKVLILQPLNKEKITQDLQKAYDNGIRSVAVALAHSYAYPQHELEIQEIAIQIGFTHVSLSHQISSSTIKLLSRASTTCCDAYLSPILNRYIQNFLKKFSPTLIDKIEISFMQSSGLLTDVKTFAGYKSLLSGPAGGYTAYSALATTNSTTNNNNQQQHAKQSGNNDDDNKTDIDDNINKPNREKQHEYIQYISKHATTNNNKNTFFLPNKPTTLGDIIGYNVPTIGEDLGGSSCDISLYLDNKLDFVFENTISDVLIGAPTLNINTIACGGGSILKFDDVSGLYTAGPHSAGSFPGPTIYGQCDESPLTITDANCIVNKINPKYFPKIFGKTQDQPLQRDLAVEKFKQLTTQINTYNQKIIQEHQKQHNNNNNTTATTTTNSNEQLTIEQCATNFLSISYSNIASAIQQLVESKGQDPQLFNLVAFGGAATQSACCVSNLLGINCIYIHSLSSILSAYGISRAAIVEESSLTINQYFTKDNQQELISNLKNIFNSLSQQTIQTLLTKTTTSKQNDNTIADGNKNNIEIHNIGKITTTLSINLKYQTTDSIINIECNDELIQSIQDENFTYFFNIILKKFEKNYRQEYGFLLSRPIILESLFVSTRLYRNIVDIAYNERLQVLPQPVDIIDCYLLNPPNQQQQEQEKKLIKQKQDNIDNDTNTTKTTKVQPQQTGQWYKTPIYQREDLISGLTIIGPCIIYDTNTTIVVELDWSAVVLDDAIVLLKIDRNVNNNNNNNVQIQSDDDDEQQQQLLTETISTSALINNTNNKQLVINEKLTIHTLKDAQEQYPVNSLLLSLYKNKFENVVVNMCSALQRTAVSVNIKQRLDFSCALFTSDGSLLVTAPSLPVHLGSMATSVKEQIFIASQPDDENGKDRMFYKGDIIVSNHPYFAGGSHLPDVNILAPIFSEPYNIGDKPIFFVCNRAHHAEIGGISPGSMPHNSALICQEGVAITSFKIVKGGSNGKLYDAPIFQEDGIREIFERPNNTCGHPECIGTRNFYDNLCDLRAQIAAVAKGVYLLTKIFIQDGLNIAVAYSWHIQHTAEVAARNLLKRLILKHIDYEIEQQENKQNDNNDNDNDNNNNKIINIKRQEYIKKYSNDKGYIKLNKSIDYMDNGTIICLTIYIHPITGNAIFDFTGTGSQVLGNINCPLSITRSAILYSIRASININNLPLNQGCLNPIDIIIPPRTILSPESHLACVGGNVLTSNRIVDIILIALKQCSNAQGCMNNFLFGNTKFGYYETICGGTSATSLTSGLTRQSHMTNTKCTDIEIFERKYPAIVRQHDIRYNTGGAGLHYGGNGAIKEVQFLTKNLIVTILSERRGEFVPNGIFGGCPGKRGENYLVEYQPFNSNNNISFVDLNHKYKILKSLGGKQSFTTYNGLQGIRILTPGAGGYGLPLSSSSSSSSSSSAMTTNINDDNNNNNQEQKQHSIITTTRIGSLATHHANAHAQ